MFQRVFLGLALLLLCQCKEEVIVAPPTPYALTFIDGPVETFETARVQQESFLHAKVDRPFSYTDSFFNGATGPFSLTGNLRGLSFNTGSGLIQGTPTSSLNVGPVTFNYSSAGIQISSQPLSFPILGDLHPPVGSEMGVREVLNQDVTGDGVKIAISDTGLEIRHEDLRDNVIPNGSRNYLDGRRDPTLSSPGSQGCHGTAVAGVIAMTGWNSKGGRGVAPYASIAGLNYLEGQSKKPSLSNMFLLDQAEGPFDIFNQSWGASLSYWLPVDTVPAFNWYVQKLRSGTTQLRGGKGAIYVKAAGNSADYNAALDVFQRSPYVIPVGALDSNNRKASYSSSGSNLWISALGRPINTTFSGDNYATGYQGTSFAAPAVSGAVALILQENSELTWREVKYILAKTAQRVEPTDTGWVTNKAGFHFNNHFGFGKIQADRAVQLAKTFPTGSLGPFEFFDSVVQGPSQPQIFEENLEIELNVSREITLEAVALEVDISHGTPHQLSLELTSPSVGGTPGTKSVLMGNSSKAYSNPNIPGIAFLSNAFYGEPSSGTWKFSISNASGTAGALNRFKLHLYGYNR
ncbi:hypothetical protein EBR03_00615 [bacterium]|nr:hypothetical protein [bacterium]